MPEYPSANHAGKPIHWVIIQMVRPGRLRVVNEEGNQGIIPEREWTLDRSIHRQTPVFAEGQRIQAVYLEDKSRPSLAQYSIAQLENPWKGLENRYKEGQAVTCEVVNLRNYAAFVQLEPGITAVVWDKDLPLFADQIPSDELVLGDKLRGVISKIDVKNQKIELDVNRYLEERAEWDLEEQAEETYQLFEKALHDLDTPDVKANQINVEEKYIAIPALNRLKRVLVVDDLEDHLINIKSSLEENYQVLVEMAASEKEGLSLFEKSLHFDLIVIDINLEIGGKGITLAKKILDQDPGQNIIFFSSDFEAEKQLSELEEIFDRIFPLARKIGSDTQDLIDAIDDFLRGRKKKPLKLIRNTPFAQGLVGSKPIEQALVDLISPLVEHDKLSHVFVLKVNTGTGKTEVLAQYPPATTFTNVDVDAIYYSPVKQVIEEGEDFHAWQVSPLSVVDDRRLKNLFSNFSFQSCYGTAVHLNGQSLKHVLFVLDRDRSFLKQEVREKITICALNLGTAIERYSVFEVLLRSQDAYYKGQLLSAMIHELNNKLVPIQRNLKKCIEELKNKVTHANWSQFDKIQQDFTNLNELFGAYIKLANKSAEEIKLNDIIEKVIRQQKGTATERSIEIFPKIDKNLPFVQSNDLQTEQVIANVLLNAIQQIDEYIKRLWKINTEQQAKFSNVFSGTVTVNTRYNPPNKVCRVEIIDSGPGVPFDKKDNIFEWGMTTREQGQGMGLYISRSLMEAMGGQLILVDTIRFVGSVFVIEFLIKD